MPIVACFNSKLVRLKEDTEIIIAGSRFEFQFQIGAIKR